MDDFGSGSTMEGPMMGMTNMSAMNMSANTSYPCNLPPFFPPFLNIPEVINYIQACIALILGIIGFTLNVFILTMIAKYKSLHQRLIYLALHIVIIDLIYTIAIPIVVFVSGVTGEYLFGVVMCNILGMIHDFFAIFRFTMTLILTLDRFISVFWPFIYRRNSMKIILTLLPIVYVVSILRVVIPLPGLFGCFLYVATQKTCTAYSGCSRECFWFVVASSLIIVTFGMIIPFILYIILFCKTKSVRKRSKSVIGSVVPTSVLTASIVAEFPSSSSAKYEYQSRRSSVGIELRAYKKNTPVCNGSSTTGAVNHAFSSETGLNPDISRQEDTMVIKRVDARSSIDSNTSDNDAVTKEFGKVLAPREESPTEEDLELSPDQNLSSQDAAVEDAVRSDSRMGRRSALSDTETQEMKFDFSSGNTLQIPGRSDFESLSRSNSHRSSRTDSPAERSSQRASTGEPDDLQLEFAAGKRSRLPRASEVKILPAITKPHAFNSSGIKSSTFRVNVTMFILLMSVIGCTLPAWSLYGIQFLYLEPEPILFIVNMMVGRTFFYFIPVMDAIAIMRHQEFRAAIKHFFGTFLKKKLCPS